MNITMSRVNGMTVAQLSAFLNEWQFELNDTAVWDLDNLYSICSDNVFVGIVSFTLDKQRNGHYCMNLHAIEIAKEYRFKGVGIAVLQYMFTEPVYKGKKLSVIHGEARNVAIDFWEKAGANFQMSAAKLRTYKFEGYSAVFTLTATAFAKAYAERQRIKRIYEGGVRK